MTDRQDAINALEKWVKNHKGETLPLAYSAVVDTLELLKEKEAVEPILEQDSMVCGVCGHEVIWQKMLGDGIWTDEKLDYCPHCGKAVKWE